MAIPKAQSKRVKKKLHIVDDAIDNFDGDIPAIQKKIFKQIVILLKDLELDDEGIIKRTVHNLNVFHKVNSIKKIILNDTYKNAVGKFVDSFDAAANEDNKYFKNL